MSICGLGKKISGDGVVLLSYGDVEEVGLVDREFRSEFDGAVERIDVVNE